MNKLKPFPLPISKNTHINGVTLRTDGLFFGYTIVWCGDFLKNNEEPTEKHVFIFQEMENTRSFLFAIWKSSEHQPRLLKRQYYDACFDKKKAVSPSNRYLFKLNDQWCLLPYCPLDLHEQWNSSFQLQNNACVSFFATIFDQHLKPLLEPNVKQTPVPPKRFIGWFNAFEKVPVDAYRKLFVESSLETSGIMVDISKHPSELPEADLKKIKNAFRIVRGIFHNLVK